MKKYAMIMAVLMLIGLASAQIPPPYEGKIGKAECLHYFAGDIGEFADEIFGAEEAYPLYLEIWESLENLYLYAIELEDPVSFNAEYIHFVSLVNEMRFLYFYYGIVEWADDPRDLGVVFDYYFEEAQPNLQQCLSGGED